MREHGRIFHWWRSPGFVPRIRLPRVSMHVPFPFALPPPDSIPWTFTGETMTMMPFTLSMPGLPGWTSTGCGLPPASGHVIPVVWGPLRDARISVPCPVARRSRLNGFAPGRWALRAWPVDHPCGSQPPGERCGNHQACPGVELVTAYCGDLCWNL